MEQDTAAVLSIGAVNNEDEEGAYLAPWEDAYAEPDHVFSLQDLEDVDLDMH